MRTPADWAPSPGPRTLGAVALGAVALDLAVQHPVGLATAAALGLVIIGSILGGWGRRAIPRWILLATIGPIVMLMVRESPWLVSLDVFAVVGLVVLAALVRDEPDPVGSAIGRLIRPARVLEPAIRSGDLMAKAVVASVPVRPGFAARMRSVLRGLALGLPIAVVLVALLASSDALFRSMFGFSIEIPHLGEHLTILVAGALASLAVASHACWESSLHRSEVRQPLGSTEVTITLGGIVLVYGAFVVTQIVAIAAGADYVRRTTGLTYAQYARAGFFQLLAAAVLTLAALLLLDRYRSPAPDHRRRIDLLQQIVVALTLTVVAVAIRRLFLYESEFGLTMLRFSTIVFAAWIGVVFVLCGLKLARRLRPEFPASVLVSAFLVLMTTNFVNPEALVASRNIDRFGGTDRLDIDYLIDNLGADAMPTIISDPDARSHLCLTVTRPDDRPAVFNLARDRAAAVYDEFCD